MCWTVFLTLCAPLLPMNNSVLVVCVETFTGNLYPIAIRPWSNNNEGFPFKFYFKNRLFIKISHVFALFWLYLTYFWMKINSFHRGKGGFSGEGVSPFTGMSGGRFLSKQGVFYRSRALRQIQNIPSHVINLYNARFSMHCRNDSIANHVIVIYMCMLCTGLMLYHNQFMRHKILVMKYY